MAKNRKTMYLIRHGEVDTQGKRCIGTTDVPLSEKGLKQAKRLGMWMARKVIREGAPYRLYTSPVSRCRDTAEQMMRHTPLKRDQLHVCEDLHEIYMGAWEDLGFAEIRERFPQEYRERGLHMWEYKVSGAESFEEAGKRFINNLKELAREEDPDEREAIYYIVAHSGVIRAALATLGEIDSDHLMDLRLPYASVTKLRTSIINQEVQFTVDYMGGHPAAVPGDYRITEILDRYRVPLHIRRHMKGVANVLLDIADILDPEAEVYDRQLLYAGAMLHDFAKLHKNLPSAGAYQLRSAGYELIADLIAEHETVNLHRELAVEHNGIKYVSEEDLLYYADKRVQEDVVVSLEDRFKRSLSKCRTPEARMQHQLRWHKAIQIENGIFRCTNQHLEL